MNQIKESEYFEMFYGNIDDMIESLEKFKDDGWTEIETRSYGHDGAYDTLKVKYRDENEQEKQKRLKEEESKRKAKDLAKEKRRRQYEMLKKEFENG